MINRKSILFLAAFALMAIQAAHAEQPAQAAANAPVARYGELDELRSENAILTEKVKNAELKAKLAAAGASSKNENFSSGQSEHRVSAYQEARILMVAGKDGQMAATIQMPDGGNTVARVGMHVPGLGVIKSIRTDEVIAESGKQDYTIPFAAEPLSNTGPSQYSPAQVPSLPIGNR